jgi:hypothetical protein
MQSAFIALGEYGYIIYPILFIGAFFAIRWLWKAWKEWREAYFGLEREIAMRRLAQAIAVVVLILALACAEFAVIFFVVPALPASSLIATPTLDLLATPMGAVDAGQGGLVSLTPIAPVAGSQGCVPGVIEITSPKPGEEVNGIVTLVGTVNIPNFGFYKFEVALRGTDVWSTIYANNKPKTNKELGVLNTSVLTPGDYLLRVVAIDTGGQAAQTCIITLRIRGG